MAEFSCQQLRADIESLREIRDSLAAHIDELNKQALETDFSVELFGEQSREKVDKFVDDYFDAFRESFPEDIVVSAEKQDLDLDDGMTLDSIDSDGNGGSVAVRVREQNGEFAVYAVGESKDGKRTLGERINDEGTDPGHRKYIQLDGDSWAIVSAESDGTKAECTFKNGNDEPTTVSIDSSEHHISTINSTIERIPNSEKILISTTDSEVIICGKGEEALRVDIPLLPATTRRSRLFVDKKHSSEDCLFVTEEKNKELRQSVVVCKKQDGQYEAHVIETDAQIYELSDGNGFILGDGTRIEKNQDGVYEVKKPESEVTITPSGNAVRMTEEYSLEVTNQSGETKKVFDGFASTTAPDNTVMIGEDKKVYYLDESNPDDIKYSEVSIDFEGAKIANIAKLPNGDTVFYPSSGDGRIWVGHIDSAGQMQVSKSELGGGESAPNNWHFDAVDLQGDDSLSIATNTESGEIQVFRLNPDGTYTVDQIPTKPNVNILGYDLTATVLPHNNGILLYSKGQREAAVINLLDHRAQGIEIDRIDDMHIGEDGDMYAVSKREILKIRIPSKEDILTKIAAKRNK